MDTTLSTADMIRMVEHGLRLAIEEDTQPENPLLFMQRLTLLLFLPSEGS
jgi:hypothetical protein